MPMKIQKVDNISAHDPVDSVPQSATQDQGIPKSFEARARAGQHPRKRCGYDERHG